MRERRAWQMLLQQSNKLLHSSLTRKIISLDLWIVHALDFSRNKIWEENYRDWIKPLSSYLYLYLLSLIMIKMCKYSNLKIPTFNYNETSLVINFKLNFVCMLKHILALSVFKINSTFWSQVATISI